MIVILGTFRDKLRFKIAVIEYLLLGLILVCLSSSVEADDWVRWRGPQADGISRESDWNSDWSAAKPTLAWTRALGTGYSSIVVKSGRAYTLGYVDGHDVVYCLDVNDGHTLWQFAYPANLDDRDFEGGPTSTPTLDGKCVYVLSRVGELFCLDATDGALHWQKPVAADTQVRLPGWGLSASPVVVDEMLLLNLGESGVALNKQDGRVIWSSKDKECGYATPVLIDGTQPKTAVIASGRAFVGIDVMTGEQLWMERWLTSFNCNAADAIIHGGKMFLSSGYNRGAALYHFKDGKPQLVWKNKEMQNQLHSSMLYEGHLYGIDGDMERGPRLRCMDWNTGEVVWSMDELQPGGLALAGGNLLLLTSTGQLMVAPASPQGWKPKGQLSVVEGKCWTVPVLSNGQVFCRSVQGTLACVNVRK